MLAVCWDSLSSSVYHYFRNFFRFYQLLLMWCFVLLVVVLSSISNAAIIVPSNSPTTTTTCHSSALPDAKTPTTSSWIIKTKETFKLSDLQLLEAQIHHKYAINRPTKTSRTINNLSSPSSNNYSSTSSSSDYDMTRLLVDASTGSSLFCLVPSYENGTDNNHIEVVKQQQDQKARKSNYQKDRLVAPTVPSTSLVRRCDWIGEVLEISTTAEELLQRLQENPPIVADGWSLDYIRMADTNQLQHRGKQQQKRTITSKGILLAIAQTIPSSPSLNPTTNVTDRLLLLDIATASPNHTSITQLITTKENALSQGNGTFWSLIRVLSISDDVATAITATTAAKTTIAHSIPLQQIQSSNSILLRKKWANRPFQYSSAINIQIAEIVIDILLDLLNKDTDCISAADRTTTSLAPANASHVEVRSKTATSSTTTAKPIIQNATTLNEQSQNIFRCLDPTCGSGTFLALAMSKNMYVEGWDNNPNCVTGTKSNLEYLFDSNRVQREALIQHGDSSSSSSSSSSLAVTRTSTDDLLLLDSNDEERKIDSSTIKEKDDEQGDDAFSRTNNNSNNNSTNQEYRILSSSSLPIVHCVVANLPWGINSLTYIDENYRILKAIRQRLSYSSSTSSDIGIPCAFVTKDDSIKSILKKSGFDVLGTAYIPPQGFILPRGKKKKKKGNNNNDNETIHSSNNNRNNCVVTIARTTSW